jgi:hypothetical protein
MSEVFRVIPFRDYPGPRELVVGSKIDVVAVNISGLLPGTNTDGLRRREVRPFGFFIDGELVLKRDILVFNAISYYAMNTNGAFGRVFRNLSVHGFQVNISNQHIRNNGGLDILLPEPESERTENPPEREYRCFLHPPERKVY